MLIATLRPVPTANVDPGLHVTMVSGTVKKVMWIAVGTAPPALMVLNAACPMIAPAVPVETVVAFPIAGATTEHKMATKRIRIAVEVTAIDAASDWDAVLMEIARVGIVWRAVA